MHINIAKKNIIKFFYFFFFNKRIKKIPKKKGVYKNKNKNKILYKQYLKNFYL